MPHIEQHEQAKKVVPDSNDLNLCDLMGKCPPIKWPDKFDEDKFGGKDKFDKQKLGKEKDSGDTSGSSSDEEHDAEADKLGKKKHADDDEDQDSAGDSSDRRREKKKLDAEEFDGNKYGKKPNQDGGMKSWMQGNEPDNEPDFLEFDNPYRSYVI